MSKIPEYIGTALGTARRWVRQHLCVHRPLTVVSEDRKRVYTKCGKCQRESTGWDLNTPAPRMTYPALPGANGVLSRSK